MSNLQEIEQVRIGAHWCCPAACALLCMKPATRLLPMHANSSLTIAPLLQGFLFPRFAGIKTVSVKLMAAVADFMVGLLWSACVQCVTKLSRA